MRLTSTKSVVFHPTSCYTSPLIQNLAQPLHLVQQDVALPHDSLILRVLERRPCCLHDAVHLVDRRVQPARRDEPGEFTMIKRGGEQSAGIGQGQ